MDKTHKDHLDRIMARRKERGATASVPPVDPQQQPTARHNTAATSSERPTTHSPMPPASPSHLSAAAHNPSSFLPADGNVWKALPMADTAAPSSPGSPRRNNNNQHDAVMTSIQRQQPLQPQPAQQQPHQQPFMMAATHHVNTTPSVVGRPATNSAIPNPILSVPRGMGMLPPPPAVNPYTAMEFVTRHPAPLPPNLQSHQLQKDYMTSLGTLCHGDWFIKWTTKRDRKHHRYFWVDKDRFLLLWSKTADASMFLSGNIRLEDIVNIHVDQQMEDTYEDGSGGVRAIYIMNILTRKKNIQIATELRGKFETWYNTLLEFTKDTRSAMKVGSALGPASYQRGAMGGGDHMSTAVYRTVGVVPCTDPSE
eukprot:PhF_6_TR28338/c0_g1_i1/m.42011